MCVYCCQRYARSQPVQTPQQYTSILNDSPHVTTCDQPMWGYSCCVRTHIVAAEWSFVEDGPGRLVLEASGSVGNENASRGPRRTCSRPGGLWYVIYSTSTSRAQQWVAHVGRVFFSKGRAALCTKHLRNIQRERAYTTEADYIAGKM